MFTDILLQKYLLATAITFGLLAFIGWLAAKYGPNAANFSNKSGHWANWFRRSTPGTPRMATDKLEKQQSLPLTATHHLHKVRDGNRIYLLATHPQGTTLISSSIEAYRPAPRTEETN